MFREKLVYVDRIVEVEVIREVASLTPIPLGCEPLPMKLPDSKLPSTLSCEPHPQYPTRAQLDSLRILVYLVIYDSGQVSLEHLLLSRHPPAHAPVDVMNENPFSQPTLSLSTQDCVILWDSNELHQIIQTPPRHLTP